MQLGLRRTTSHVGSTATLSLYLSHFDATLLLPNWGNARFNSSSHSESLSRNATTQRHKRFEKVTEIAIGKQTQARNVPMNKQRLGFQLFALAAMGLFTACGSDGTAGLDSFPSVDQEFIADPLPYEDCGDGYCAPSEEGVCSIDCGASYCGDGACNSTNETCSTCPDDCGACFDPNVINVPGTPQLDTMTNLRALAQQLGVPPHVAGIPNIQSYLQNVSPVKGPTIADAYPHNTVSVQDFMNKLFQNGTWQTTPTAPTTTNLPNDQYGCTLRQINAMVAPDQLVSFDMGAGLLFPSALNQGRFINLGLGGLMPINVPYTKRKPVHLVSTLYQTGTAATATATDVYSTMGNMIQAANAAGAFGQSVVYYDLQSASSLEEAAAKFKLDVNVFGAGVKATFSNITSTQNNTVFVNLTQNMFAVFADLQGYTPPMGLFNSNLTVGDLEQLGDVGELAYDNLPTFNRATIYGRSMLVGITSTVSKQELEAAVDVAWLKNSAQATYQQKKIIENSQVRFFAYGGPAEPQLETIKSGNWRDYFTMMNVPLNTLKPLGYEVRRLDNQPAAMLRSTSYTERTCPPVIHPVKLELRDLYKTIDVYVRPNSGAPWQAILNTGSNTTLNLNPYLAGADDEMLIHANGGRPYFLASWQWKVNMKIFVDNATTPYINLAKGCTSCNSKDVWICKINKYLGAPGISCTAL